MSQQMDMLDVATRVALFRFRVPLREAIPGSDRQLSREGLIVKMDLSDGRVLLGECSPLPGFSSESLADSADELLKGCREWSVHRQFVPTLASVQFCVESLSMHSSAIQNDEVQPGPEGDLYVNALVGASRAGMEQSHDLVQRGFRTIKVKVGHGDAAEEAQIVSRIADRDEALRLRLDANRIWNLNEALDFSARLRSELKALGVDPDCIEYFEEPVSDVYDLEAFADESGFLVALDETVRDQTGWTDVIDLSFVGAVVVKPTLSGLRTCVDVASTARSYGIDVVVSSSFESAVGLLALARFAQTIPQENVASGLGTHAWILRDLLVPRPDLSGPVISQSDMINCHFELDGSIQEGPAPESIHLSKLYESTVT